LEGYGSANARRIIGGCRRVIEFDQIIVV